MSNAEAWAAWTARKLEAAGQGQQASRGPDQGRQRSERPAFGVPQGSTEHQDGAVPRTLPDCGPFPQRQGNGEHGADPGDESDPRRPGDPPWRSRTARRTSTPEATAAFRNARVRRGWSLTRAAKETCVSRPHLSLLERGLRRPSESVAEAIITVYRMTPEEADAVSAIAVPWAGRDSPHRTGVAPGEW